MDPITIIVTALAAGATARLSSTATQAVMDAYTSLKSLVAGRYAKAALAVDLLEVAPDSKARRGVVEEELAKTDAARDEELARQVQALLEAVQTHTPATADAIGVNLAGVIAAGNIHIHDIQVIQNIKARDIQIIVSPDELRRFEPSRTWILVAGLGQDTRILQTLFPSVYHGAGAVGRSIASQGFGLLVGGWGGVDYVVAKEFAAELGRLKKPLGENLLQVVPEDHMPAFPGGKVVHVKPGWLEWADMARKADAAVLIGGAGGTYTTYEFALQERKPVFPLECTGGDAKKVFLEMVASWDTQPVDKLSRDDFIRVLSQEIVSKEDADRVADELMALIRQRLSVSA